MSARLLVYLLKRLLQLFVPSLFLLEPTSKKRPRHDQALCADDDACPAATDPSPPVVMSIPAAPGLITFLDHALYRSYEGQLTATMCAANALLSTYLKLKDQAAQLMRAVITDGSTGLALLCDTASSSSLQAMARFLLWMERLAKASLEYAALAIERISTDPLSLTTHWIPSLHTEPATHFTNTARYDASADYESYIQQTPHRLQAAQAAHLPILDEDGHRIMMALHNTTLDVNASPMPNNTKANNNRQNSLTQTDRSSYNNTDFPSYFRSYSRIDCWESSRLFCPDYVWAEETFTTCQKLLRPILRHELLQLYLPYGNSKDALYHIWNHLSGETQPWQVLQPCISKLYPLLQILTQDLSPRLLQFKKATLQVNARVLQRLYQIKHEYRAPFRAFLESHIHVQKMPRLDFVQQYIQSLDHDPNLPPTTDTEDPELQDTPLWIQRKREAERKIQLNIQNPTLVQALEMEQSCEELEMDMATMIFPFTELARFLESKGGRIKVIPSLLSPNRVPPLEELLRRLRSLLAPKMIHHPSAGIRQILLDLQGVERDVSSSTYPVDPFGNWDSISHREAALERVQVFLHLLTTLGSIAKIQGGFYFMDKNPDIPPPLLKACISSLDVEMFQALFEDWYDCAQRQGELMSIQVERPDSLEPFSLFEKLFEDIRQAEMELSIAMAPLQALSTVRQRLEQVEEDRSKRFQILQEIVVDICSREMDIRLDLKNPDKQRNLRLPEVPSAVGLFGTLLQSHGEPLPL